MIFGFGTEFGVLAVAGGGAVAIKLVVVMAMSLGGLYVAPLVNMDAIRVKINRGLWSGLILIAIFLGATLWLVIPSFGLGLLLFLVLNLGVLISYVLHRNSQVNPEDRLFSKEWFENRKSPASREASLETKLKLYDNIGRFIQLTESELKDKNLVDSFNLTQSLLYDITLNRAGEVDMSPTGEQVRLRYTIDGVVSTRESISNADSVLILPYLLQTAGIDMKSKGHAQVQKGKITVDIADSPTNMELIAKETVAGPRIRIRVIQQLVQTNIDLLGIVPTSTEQILSTTKSPGLLLISGPPKSGVTSTMYSILRRQDAYMNLLMTVESSSPLDMENVTQHSYGDIVNLPQELASAIRRDPDVLLIDQCPDTKAAKQICDFVRENFVILGLPAKDVFTALLTWLKLMGGTSAGLTPLRGITCQALIRRLCPTCKVPYTPDPQTKSKLNLMRVRAGISEPLQEIYRTPQYPRTDDKDRPLPPCETCQDTGFFGLIGAFEFLPIDQGLMELMRSKATLKQIKSHAKNAGMMTIYEQALCQVSQGLTSIKEVLRVCKREDNRK